MAETWFTPKEWKARLVEFAGRRLLRNVANGETVTYDVSRSEGQVSQEGDAFNTQNMNDLEQRISNGFANAKTKIDALNRDLDVGSDSGMTIGSMVKAIYDKVINSAAISGHLRGGRSRGGSGTGEVTFNNIKKGSTITISSVVIPSGAEEAIKTTVDGDIVITGAGSYTLTKDGTVKITAHVYLGEEGTSGYAECDFKIV